MSYKRKKTRSYDFLSAEITSAQNFNFATKILLKLCFSDTSSVFWVKKTFPQAKISAPASTTTPCADSLYRDFVDINIIARAHIFKKMHTAQTALKWQRCVS